MKRRSRSDERDGCLGYGRSGRTLSRNARARAAIDLGYSHIQSSPLHTVHLSLTLTLETYVLPISLSMAGHLVRVEDSV